MKLEKTINVATAAAIAMGMVVEQSDAMILQNNVVEESHVKDEHGEDETSVADPDSSVAIDAVDFTAASEGGQGFVGRFRPTKFNRSFGMNQ